MRHAKRCYDSVVAEKNLSRALLIFTVVQIIAVALVLGLLFTRPGPWDWQRELGSALVLWGSPASP